MKRLIGAIAVIAGSMVIPGTAQAAWELPTPVISPGDYKSKTYSTKVYAGDWTDNLEHLDGVDEKVTIAIAQNGRVLFSQTSEYDALLEKPLFPGNYQGVVTRYFGFPATRSVDELDGSSSYPTGFACEAVETSRTATYDSGGYFDGFNVVATVTCTHSTTGTIYSAALTETDVYQRTPLTIDYFRYSSGLLTLTTPATFTETKTVPFTVKAVNGPTVTYDEYSLIKTGMKRAKVEKIFGNASPVFYRKVKKGNLFIYDSHVYITYKNNKVTNYRWTGEI